ncbi:hypothetical protein PsAD37_00055 [Pseudovibrio sp. Ad37]|nr:hypothetical protein PsAD37_00055 [Pseudovibrio sp. Ad37]
MRTAAFHMHWAIPAGAQDLCYAACIILIGLVTHGRQSRIHLPCLHADNVKAVLFLQAVKQRLAHCSSFKANAGDQQRRLS